jgi:chromosome segregation ATPase
MADDLQGFAEGRDSIESRMSTLGVTVTTEARVRAQMDQDISDLSVKFDAQEKLLKALRETQSDHSSILRDHTSTLRDHTATLEDHTARLTRLEAGQAEVLAGVQAIIGLLDPGTDNPAEQ